MDRSRELFSRAIAGGAGPKGARAALAGFALLVPGAAWYSTVTASPQAGAPIPLPGTFQAANFDRGSEGIGYHDTTTGNAPGSFPQAPRVNGVLTSVQWL
jgi:hypothetical protein